MQRLFDSHAHLNNETYTADERAALIREIESSAVTRVMDIGFDLASSRLAAEHAARLAWCYAAVGVHPHDADSMDEDTLAEIRRLAGLDKVQAIGEIGLDFHYDNSDREAQVYWFRRQIRLANELRLPIVIHSREADQLTLDILVEEGAFSEERKSWFLQRLIPGGKPAGDARVLLHCFSGSRELGQQYVKLGATLSVAGPVTYKNNRRTVEMVAAIPLEYLLAETDAPYLTPVPFRGRPNKSPYVEHTVRKIAEIKGISYEEAAERTFRNAEVFFNIDEHKQPDTNIGHK